MAGPYAPSDSRNYVGIGKQASRGTAVAPATWVPYLPSVDKSHGMDISPIKEAGAAGQVTDSEKGGHLPTGKVTFNARPSLIGKLGAYLLGVDSITGAGPYDHAETSDFVTDYLSVEQNLADDFVERFKDCVINEITVSVDADNPKLKVESSWLGGTPVVQGSPTAESYETDRPFLLSDCVFTIDGSGATNVRKFTYTARMLYAREKLIDVVPEYHVKVGEECEIEIEQLVTADMADFRKVNYGAVAGTAHTKSAFVGAFIANFAYGAGAAARGIKFEVPNFEYDEATHTALSPEGNEAVKVMTKGYGKMVAGSFLQKLTAKTNDSAAYVT